MTLTARIGKIQLKIYVDIYPRKKTSLKIKIAAVNVKNTKIK